MEHWSEKYQRKCNDGGRHDGLLELMTWNYVEEGTELGWGGCYAEDSEKLQKKFREEFNSNEEKFYDYWPQGFRWTCCGATGDVDFCDHHGSGSTKCRCDYCTCGQRLPDEYILERARTQAAQGLTLANGRMF